MVGGWQHQLMFGCETKASGRGHLAQSPADRTGTVGGGELRPMQKARVQVPCGPKQLPLLLALEDTLLQKTDGNG